MSQQRQADLQAVDREIQGLFNIMDKVIEQHVVKYSKGELNVILEKFNSGVVLAAAALWELSQLPDEAWEEDPEAEAWDPPEYNYDNHMGGYE